MIDPLVAVDGATGTVVLVWGELPSPCNNFGGHYYTTRSTDGGATWTAPVQVSDLPTEFGGMALQEHLALRGGTLYFAWYKSATSPPVPPYNIPGIYFRRSTDGGATWSPPAQVVDGRLLGDVVSLGMAVGPGGAVYVVYGRSYLADPDGRPAPVGAGSSWRFLTFLARSTDDGATWTYPVRVDDCPECDATPGTSSVSSGIAVDEATGDVYVAFVDGRNHCGDPIPWFSDLFMRRSTDGGRSWGPSAQRSDPVSDNSLNWAVNVRVANGNVYTLFGTWDRGMFLDIQPAGALPPGPTPAPTGTPAPTATPTPPLPEWRVGLPWMERR